MAGELRKLGYTVTEHVGKYADGAQAEGVVAMLENGAGPRLLLRTDWTRCRWKRRPAWTTPAM
jgi:hypothetical protein